MSSSLWQTTLATTQCARPFISSERLHNRIATRDRISAQVHSPHIHVKHVSYFFRILLALARLDVYAVENLTFHRLHVFYVRALVTSIISTFRVWRARAGDRREAFSRCTNRRTSVAPAVDASLCEMRSICFALARLVRFFTSDFFFSRDFDLSSVYLRASCSGSARAGSTATTTTTTSSFFSSSSSSSSSSSDVLERVLEFSSSRFIRSSSWYKR